MKPLFCHSIKDDSRASDRITIPSNRDLIMMSAVSYPVLEGRPKCTAIISITCSTRWKLLFGREECTIRHAKRPLTAITSHSTPNGRRAGPAWSGTITVAHLLLAPSFSPRVLMDPWKTVQLVLHKLCDIDTALAALFMESCIVAASR